MVAVSVHTAHQGTEIGSMFVRNFIWTGNNLDIPEGSADSA